MKQIFFTISILTILSLSVLAQNQVPSPRYGHFSFSIYDTVSQQNVFYIFGGYTSDNNKTTKVVKDQLFRLQGANFAPVEISGQPLNSNFQMFAKIPGTNMIYMEPYRESSCYSVYEIRPNPSTNTATCDSVCPLPSELQGVTKFGTAYDTDGNAIIMGGVRSNASASVSASVLVFNHTTKTFTNCPFDIPQGGRYGFSTFETATDAFILGGRGSDHNINGTPLVLSKQYKSWDIPTCQGDFPHFVSDPVYTTYNGTLFVAGGQGYTYKKSTLEDEVIATKLYKISANGNTLNGTLLTDEFPPIVAGAGWVDIIDNDTIFYTFGGISSISTNGDTTFTNNFYRYNITDNLVQQYDTTQQTWGGILSINEAEFDKNINLQIYPNPATSEINLAIPNNESIVSIKIYNQNGQLVKQIFKPNAEKINISDLKTGIYFIRTDTDTNRYLSKMIKD